MSSSSSSLQYSSSSSFGTYEATQAANATRFQPDPIHWHDGAAFRDCNYRQLHHQRGCIGLFHVRLLEAANLQRSYWSALALGPVKHLGLSKAHGAVSSFCTFRLNFSADSSEDEDAKPQQERSSFSGGANGDQKPAAKPGKNSKQQPAVVSPVVPHDNNPVWDSCQFEFPLKKGASAAEGDGMRILLQVAVEEDATAVDNFNPLSGGNRLIGIGTLDLTELCLGETVNGQPLPGVRDAWIDISLPQNNNEDVHHPPPFSDNDKLVYYSKNDPLAPPPTDKQSSSSSEPPKLTGMVRVLVSYQPVGLEPQPKDIVALESFARRNPATTSCRPVMEPLMPLTVLERRGSYVLCEYLLAGAANHNNNKVCVRLHRNAVFVIERQNLLDAAHNLALLPVDVVLSTPVGRACQQALGPVAHAGQELLMPIVLTGRLAWMAARTTGLGVLSGVHALGTTLWHEGATSLTGGRRHAQHRGDEDYHSHHQQQHRRDAAVRRDSRAATAKFVQL